MPGTLEEVIVKSFSSPTHLLGCFCSIFQAGEDPQWKRASPSELLGLGVEPPGELGSLGKWDLAIVDGVVFVCSAYIQKASGLQKGRRKEEAPHKETS